MSPTPSFDFNLFRAMEVFLAIVETGQVTKAAAKLSMTQSAASQQLKLLESTMGVSLLDRSSRPVKLTQAGVSLQYRAQRVMGEIDQLSHDINRSKPGKIPVLRIGLLASIATTLMADLVRLGQKKFGISDMSVHAGISSDHQTLLRSRQADLVVTCDDLSDMDGLTRFPILNEKFLLITPNEYAGPFNNLRLIADHLPLVRFSPHTLVGRQTEQHLRRLQLDIPRSINADRSSMLTAAVAAGQGFAILTPSLIIDGLVEGMPLTVKPLPAPGFTRDITLISRTGELDDLPALFAREVRKNLKNKLSQVVKDLPDDAVRFIYE